MLRVVFSLMNMKKKRQYDTEAWAKLLLHLKSLLGKTPDLNAILFLIGVQELGKGLRDFSKEEKQDLMHIAVCKLLSLPGYYRLTGTDKDGWPQWESTELLPYLSLAEQEDLLRMNILEYFASENIFDAFENA
jgi:hypothetical protein